MIYTQWLLLWRLLYSIYVKFIKASSETFSSIKIDIQFFGSQSEFSGPHKPVLYNGSVVLIAVILSSAILKNLKTLLVANMPSSQHEDTTKIITSLAAKLETSMLPGDIDSAFRIKSDAAVHSSKPALIMVKFTNTASRDRFYNARKNFNKLSITTQSVGFRRSEKIFTNEAQHDPSTHFSSQLGK